MNFANIAVIRRFGGIGDSQVYFAVVKTLLMLLTVDVSVIYHPIVAGVYSAQVAEVVENLFREIARRC